MTVMPRHAAGINLPGLGETWHYYQPFDVHDEYNALDIGMEERG